MFERYEEKARRVIFFARYETSTLGGDYIEPEHLVLALLREWQWLKAAVSSDAIEKLRSEVERRAGKAARHQTSVDLPLSHAAKRVLAFAVEEAERLNDKAIRCGHLACGILRDPESVPAQWLIKHGVTLERLRQTMLQAAEPAPANQTIVQGLRAALRQAAERLDWTVEPALRFTVK